MSIEQRSDLDFLGAARIFNLPAATLASHPVILSQLNSAVEGLSWKDNVRAGSSANLTLAVPGVSVGGVTMAVNDRFLARGQTAQTENGIYIYNGAATAATRASDANTFDELESATVTVDEGTDAGTTWRQTQVNGVIGTNNVIFASFGAAAAAASETTAGIAEIATQAETDTGTDDARIVTPLKLAKSVYASRKFNQTFGDGTATSYTFTHNFNTRDVQVQFYDVGTFREFNVEVTRTTVNSVTAVFAAGLAPATNSARVVIQA